MAEQYKPGPPSSGVSMGQLWRNAEKDSEAPKYQIQQRTLRIYNRGLEVTANTEGNLRTGEAYGLRSLGTPRDSYTREIEKPEQLSQYLFGRREDASYKKAA